MCGGDSVEVLSQIEKAQLTLIQIADQSVSDDYLPSSDSFALNPLLFDKKTTYKNVCHPLQW